MKTIPKQSVNGKITEPSLKDELNKKDKNKEKGQSYAKKKETAR